MLRSPFPSQSNRPTDRLLKRPPYHSARAAKQASYMYCTRSCDVRRIPTAELKLWGTNEEIFIFINFVFCLLLLLYKRRLSLLCVIEIFMFRLLLAYLQNEPHFEHNQVIFIQFWLLTENNIFGGIKTDRSELITEINFCQSAGFAREIVIQFSCEGWWRKWKFSRSRWRITPLSPQSDDALM